MPKLIIACLATATLAACGGSSKDKTRPDAPLGSGSGGPDAPAAPTSVAITVQDMPASPAMVGYFAMYQDGSGAWQAAPAPVNNVYTLAIDSSTWGFGIACTGSASNGSASVAETDVELANFTVGERTALTATVPAVCRTAATTYNVNGTISNLPTSIENGGTYVAYFGDVSGTVTVTGTNGTFRLDGVVGASRDLFIVHTPAATGEDETPVPDEVYRSPRARRRDRRQRHHGRLEHDRRRRRHRDRGRLGLVDHVIATTLYTASGTQLPLSSAANSSVFLGASQIQTTDVFEQSASFNSGAGVAQAWMAAATTPSLAAPAQLGGADASVTATTPYPIVTTTWNAYSDAIGYAWLANESTGSGSNAATVNWLSILSADYAGAHPSYAMPDLHAISGWGSAEQLSSGQVQVTVEAFQSSGGVGDLPFATPAAAGTTRAGVGYSTPVTVQ